MPGALQEEGLHPVQPEGALAQFVQHRGDAPTLDALVHPWRKEEDHQATRQADAHAVDGDAEIFAIERGYPNGRSRWEPYTR